MIMGLVGITEGTIPFAVKDPLRVIPSIVVGTAVACGLNGFWCYSRNNAFNLYGNSFCYEYTFIFSINCYWGVVTALMVNALKSIKYKKEQQVNSVEEGK